MIRNVPATVRRMAQIPCERMALAGVWNRRADAAEPGREEPIAGHGEIGPRAGQGVAVERDEGRAHDEDRDRPRRPAARAGARNRRRPRPARSLLLLPARGSDLAHGQDVVIGQGHPQIDGDQDGHAPDQGARDVAAGVADLFGERRDVGPAVVGPEHADHRGHHAREDRAADRRRPDGREVGERAGPERERQRSSARRRRRPSGPCRRPGAPPPRRVPRTLTVVTTAIASTAAPACQTLTRIAAGRLDQLARSNARTPRPGSPSSRSGRSGTRPSRTGTPAGPRRPRGGRHRGRRPAAASPRARPA